MADQQLEDLGELTTGNLVDGDLLFVVDVSDTTDDAGGTSKKILASSIATYIGAGTAISNVVEDTTPQLGGSLDVNGQKIVSVSDGDIDIEPNGTGNVLLGNLTIDADQTVGAGQDDYVLTYDDGTGLISLEAAAGGGGGDVTKVGTPVDNQVGVWTGDGTIEGDANLTWDATTLLLSAGDVTLSDGIVSITGKDDEQTLKIDTPSAYVDGVTGLTETYPIEIDYGGNDIFKIDWIGTINSNVTLSGVRVLQKWFHLGSLIASMTSSTFTYDGEASTAFDIRSPATTNAEFRLGASEDTTNQSKWAYRREQNTKDLVWYNFDSASAAGELLRVQAALAGNEVWEFKIPVTGPNLSITETATGASPLTVTSAASATSSSAIINVGSGQTGRALKVKNSGGTEIANIDNAGRVRAASGTASSPGLSFTNETDSGFYIRGSDIFTISVSTNPVMEFAGAPTYTPQFKLAGNASFGFGGTDNDATASPDIVIGRSEANVLGVYTSTSMATTAAILARDLTLDTGDLTVSSGDVTLSDDTKLLKGPAGSVVAGNAPGITFNTYTDTGLAANADNIVIWESGTIALVLSNAVSEFRVPSDYSYAWSTATNNNATADLSLHRVASSAQRMLEVRPTGSTLTTGLTFYNDPYHATNFERFHLMWSGDVCYLNHEIGGTGTARDVHIHRAGVDMMKFTDTGTEVTHSSTTTTALTVTSATNPATNPVCVINGAGTPTSDLLQIQVAGSSVFKVDQNALLEVLASGTDPILTINRDAYWAHNFFSTYSAGDANHAPQNIYVRGRGTKASPANINSGDQMGGFYMRGYAGGTSKNHASVVAYAEGSVSGSYVATRLVFSVGNAASDADTLGPQLELKSTSSVLIGKQAALATNATDGFAYIPSCAGTPTGTPTSVTGLIPICVDSTNHKLYFYSGGSWRDAGP